MSNSTKWGLWFQWFDPTLEENREHFMGASSVNNCLVIVVL